MVCNPCQKEDKTICGRVRVLLGLQLASVDARVADVRWYTYVKSPNQMSMIVATPKPKVTMDSATMTALMRRLLVRVCILKIEMNQESITELS